MKQENEMTKGFVGRVGNKVFTEDCGYDLEAMNSRAEYSASVFICTYSKYAEGRALDGAWVPLSDFADYDEFLNFCYALHGDEPRSSCEPMFVDFQNFPRAFYSESGLSEHFDDILAFDALDSDDQQVAETWMNLGYDFSDWQSHYQGSFDSEEDFAEYLFDEIYGSEVPDFLQNYISYEKFARDLFCGDYIFDNGYVFSCA